jgi:hypothetical protein
MDETNAAVDVEGAGEVAASKSTKPAAKLKWETPKLEDVSEEVMAQPYIRFT